MVNHRAAILAAVILLGGCQTGPVAPMLSAELVAPEVLARHDYRLADTRNKRTALAYLYTAWNDGQLRKARETYWLPGSFAESGAMQPPPPGTADAPPQVEYRVHKVIEESDHVVVLALVRGLGIGEPITTIFGTDGGIKIGDAVVEIFRFAENGLIAEKWDTIQPVSEQTYDFR